MKNLNYIFSILVFVSLNTAAGGEQDLVGCWEATLIDVENNVATICINHEIGSITYYYTNEGDKPTRCYQHAFLKYEEDSIFLEGVGGFCDNGRQQAQLNFRCRNTTSTTMPCEMFMDYTELKMKKVEKK